MEKQFSDILPQKQRAGGIYGVRGNLGYLWENKAVGWFEAWGKVIGKRCGNWVIVQLQVQLCL